MENRRASDGSSTPIEDVDTGSAFATPSGEAQLERLASVYQIGLSVAVARTHGEIASALATCLDRAIDYDRASLILARDENMYRRAAHWESGAYVSGWATSSHDAKIPDDILVAIEEIAQSTPRPAVQHASPSECLILQPIEQRERLLGVLELQRASSVPFNPEDAKVLSILADSIASAIVTVDHITEGNRVRTELAEIIDTSRSFSAFADARELCSAISERAAQLVNARSGFVAILDMQSNTAFVQEPGFNLPGKMAHEISFPFESGMGGIDPSRWLEPFYSNDPAKDSRFASLLSDSFQPESILCAPMRAKGATVGFIFVADRPEGFTQKAAHLLATIAPQAAAALSNARLIEAVHMQAQREALLNRITTAVRESLELDQVLETTVRVLGQSLDLCRCYVAFVDKPQRTVHVTHEFHVPEVGSTRGDFPIQGYGSSLLKSMESGETFVVDDVAVDERVAPFRSAVLDPLGVRSLMYVPVLQERTLAAVIGLSQCRWNRHWEHGEITLAQAVADQLSVAMRQAQLYDHQRRTADYRELINRVNAAVRRSLDLETILQTAVDELGQALEVDRCFVLAPGPFPQTLESSIVRFEYCKAGITSVKGLKVPLRNRAREGPVGMIEEPLVIADIAENPRLVSRRKADLLALTETRAMVSIRAVYGNQILAALELDQCFEPRQWQREEVELVTEVAAQLAVGIHNALLFRRITDSEKQWNTTFNSMTDGVALLDPTGLVQQLNESMLRLCALDDPEEAMGRHCYELLYGEKSTTPQETPVERVLSTGSRVQIERDIPARDLSLREAIDPIFDDRQQIAGLVMVVRDVTREREADRAIRYRNRQLAALNAIAAAATRTLATDEILEGAFAKIVDVTSADAGAILLLDEQRVWLDMAATHGGAALASTLVNRDPTDPLTTSVLEAQAPISRDESTVGPEDATAPAGIASALYAPIRSQQRPIGLLVIGYHGRRNFSANERQLLTVAGQQIGAAIENARLIANLQLALERIQEANRLKDEFLATVSHELRTPLTAIQGWAEVLSDPELNDRERDEGLETIQQASSSLTQLISDLLEMSRIETRMLRLDLQEVDPNYPVRAALQTVRQMADNKAISIDATLEEDLPVIQADPGRLQQVMWNLLINAIKFTPHGGRLRIETQTEADTAVVIRVQDNGIGIEPSFLPHVFERFRQADGSATRHYGGLGIGLSLVRSLVEAHNGTVTAESKGPGEGSTFTVRLPVASGPSL